MDKRRKVILCRTTEFSVIAGIDEAGRGAGAAGVYAGAVILDPYHPIAGLADSKTLTALQRETLSDIIMRHALCWSVAHADVPEIESMNILNATMLAMKRAVEGLSVKPQMVLVDGNRIPELDIPAEAIVAGDAVVPSISAASILAKVARDRAMLEYHRLYPQYRFDLHKGYFTKTHTDALRMHGPCPIHRRTYAPVKAIIDNPLWTQEKIFSDEALS